MVLEFSLVLKKTAVCKLSRRPTGGRRRPFCLQRDSLVTGFKKLILGAKGTCSGLRPHYQLFLSSLLDLVSARSEGLVGMGPHGWTLQAPDQ